MSDTPTFDPNRAEWPEFIRPDPGLCYCQSCHLQGAKWEYRGEAYHDDCVGKILKREDRAKLAG